MYRTQAGFRTILKRDKLSTFIAPKNLHPSQIDDLQQNPYHITKQKKQAINKPTRGLPLNVKNKKEFQSKVKNYLTYFSVPKAMPGEKISLAEQ